MLRMRRILGSHCNELGLVSRDRDYRKQGRQPSFPLPVNGLKHWVNSIRPGFWFLLILAAKLCSAPAASAEFAGAGSTSLPPDEHASSTWPKDDAIGGWHFVRSAGTSSEQGASAILHTADFERSDPRFAGLMLRCGREGIEAVIVVIEPFPPAARPEITLHALGKETKFTGTVIPTGAGIRLPRDATGLITGAWHAARDLDVKVIDGDKEFHGTVTLLGLTGALESLNADCIQK